MIRKLAPLLIGLVALAAGFGAGRIYAPEGQAAKTEDATPHGKAAGGEGKSDEGHAEKSGDAADDKAEFIKMSNQFVIPVIEGGRVTSLVIVSLSIETAAGQGEVIYTREPKLRDGLLQAMFDHANSGGFRGEFTDIAQMNGLRRALLEVAQSTLSRDLVRNVLITEIVRQDA